MKRNNFFRYIIQYNCFIVILFCSCSSQNTLQESLWPEAVKKIEYLSSADSTEQFALIYTPFINNKKLPLLVALHTWSGDYTQKGGSKYAEWCIKNNWYLIHPNFRGPNNTPQAMGSEYVVADILSAVKYMEKKYQIDDNRIYLVGYSGGGMASLLMAGRVPEIWAAVSAWDGISDLKEWWEYSEEYRQQIEAAAGGNPNNSKTLMDEYIKRSPITYLQNAKDVKLDINAGVDDETVPFFQSLEAYNKIVDKEFQLSSNEINEFYKTKKVSLEIKDVVSDSLYGNKYPIFRRVAGNTRITIFKGGHEIIHEAALTWLSKQHKYSPPIW